MTSNTPTKTSSLFGCLVLCISFARYLLFSRLIIDMGLWDYGTARQKVPEPVEGPVVPQSRSLAVPKSRSLAVPKSRSLAVSQSRSLAVPKSKKNIEQQTNKV